MKKLLSILLAVVMLFALTACGNSDSESENTTPAATTETTEPEVSEPEVSEPESTQPETTETESEAAVDETAEGGEPRALVVYFSATGNTEALAGTIAEAVSADIFELVPEQPYTDEDLNYNNDDCRANREMDDETARPAFVGSIENFEDYDVIFLGYPIWWGTMPRIINTFIDTYDLEGKTIMPFCTSGGSGISGSVSDLRELCPDSVVDDGFRGSATASEEEVLEWLSDSSY